MKILVCNSCEREIGILVNALYRVPSHYHFDPATRTKVRRDKDVKFLDYNWEARAYYCAECGVLTDEQYHEENSSDYKEEDIYEY